MAEFVQFRGSRQDVTRLAHNLGSILVGDSPDQQDIAKGFLLTLGFAALTDIKDAFIIKARGGTDEMGISWPPLSKEYLAYGRRYGPGEQAALKRQAGLGRQHRRAPGGHKGLLTAAQLKLWRRIYVEYASRFMLSEPESMAKSHAAAIAWTLRAVRRGLRLTDRGPHKSVGPMKLLPILAYVLGFMTLYGVASVAVRVATGALARTAL